MLRAALCITANSGCQCPLYPQKRTLADTYQRWCVGTQPNKSRGADRCRHPQKSQEFRRSDDPLNGERMASKGSSARTKAEIRRRECDVRFMPKADICSAAIDNRLLSVAKLADAVPQLSFMIVRQTI